MTNGFLKLLSISLLLSGLIALSGCSDDAGTATSDSGDTDASGTDSTDTSAADTELGTDTVERPDGWVDESHSNSAAPDYSMIFPQDSVPEMTIVFEAEDWAAMQAEMATLYGAFGQGSSMPVPPGGGGGPGTISETDPTMVECEVRFNGDVWTHVGIRYKGNSTLRDSWQGGSYKLPLRIEFDQFEDTWPETLDQRFWGFKTLSLGAGIKDDSYLRDKLAGDLFRENGVPSPQRAFWRINVDPGTGTPIYYGVYTVVELPEEHMLDNQFTSDDGNVYKPEGTAAQWLDGETLDQTSFEKKTNEDTSDWSDVLAARTALYADRTDAAAWRAGLEATFDVDVFLKWLALNTVWEDWDVYGKMSHNYYLYGDPAQDGRLVWIPWDHNEAFGVKQGLSIGLTEVGEDWPLIRFLMDDPEYLATYQSNVNAFLDTGFTREALEARVQAAHDLIAPYATTEVAGYTALSSVASFNSSVESLLSFVDSRRSEILSASANW